MQRDFIADFSFQQLLYEKGTMLDVKHTAYFVILFFFFQDALFMTYFLNNLCKNLLFFRSFIEHRSFSFYRTITLYTFCISVTN
jgi:hypothetical protein